MLASEVAPSFSQRLRAAADETDQLLDRLLAPARCEDEVDLFLSAGADLDNALVISLTRLRDTQYMPPRRDIAQHNAA